MGSVGECDGIRRVVLGCGTWKEKRREDMFCGGECVMGSASTSDAKSNQDASLCGRTLNFTTHLICEVHDLLHSTLYNTKHLL